MLILVSVLLVSKHLVSHQEGAVTVVSVHPTWPCTSLLGVVPVGSGEGVGDCHDVAKLLKKCLSIPPQHLPGGRNCVFFQGTAFFCWILLDMLVAKREPTPCYRDAHSAGTPKWSYWVKRRQIHWKTTFSPLYGRLFLVSKRTNFFFGRVVVWMLHIGRARHPGPGTRFFTLVSCRLSLQRGGWLTMGSGFGFLCSVPGGS